MDVSAQSYISSTAPFSDIKLLGAPIYFLSAKKKQKYAGENVWRILRCIHTAYIVDLKIIKLFIEVDQGDIRIIYRNLK